MCNLSWRLITISSLFILANGSACNNGGPTSLSVAYTYDGHFTVSIAYPLTSNYCSVELVKWGGTIVSGVYHRGACNSFSPDPFTPAVDGDGAFSYGVEYGFGLSVYAASDYSGSVLCTAPFVYVTPPLCTGANYGYTSLGVIKRPYGYIKAMVTNKPLTGSCYFHLSYPIWDGSPVSMFSGTDDCSPVQFHATDFNFGLTSFTVGMIAAPASSDQTSVQPLCGINSRTIFPAPCSSGTEFLISGPDSIAVNFYGAAPGQKCELYILRWNGDLIVSRGLTKTSPDCSSVTITTSDIGAPLVLDQDVYEFEYAEFPVGTLNTELANPTCYSDMTRDALSTPTCDESNLYIVRADPGTVRVWILSAESYGVCRVSLVSFDYTTVSVDRIGNCTESFDFRPPTGAVTFTSGTAVGFVYAFYADGDITSNATCNSSTASSSIGDFNCDGTFSIVATHSQIVQTMYIAEFFPATGTCYLTNDVNSARIQFPSCSSAMDLNFADVLAIIPSMTPGDSVIFSYAYRGPESSTDMCTGNSASATMIAGLALTVGTVSESTISVSVADLPSYLSAYSTKNCRVSLDSCTGTTPVGFTSILTGCTGAATFHDPIEIPAGSICQLHVDLDVGNGYGAGTSEQISVVAASVPVWGERQTPVITWYGSDCVDITWDAPESDGGSAVVCYEVQRKDGTGQYKVMARCTSATTARSCRFKQGTSYYFQVIATNRVGRSTADTCVSSAFRPEWRMSAPASVILAPEWNDTSYVAGGFPTVTVRENHPTNPVGAPDADTTDRLFVGRLVNRCKLDSATSTITQALVPGDTNYSSLPLPIAPNGSPAFTQVFVPVRLTVGTYELAVATQPLKGPYSLLVHSLEEGGLNGQYFPVMDLSGSFSMERKDPVMNFAWGTGPIINGTSGPQFADRVSIRWTGFVEAAYSETYTFTVTSLDRVRVWINDVLIINKWTDRDMCGGSCSGQAALQLSVPGDGSRKFSYIRIDYSNSKASVGGQTAAFKLSWSSFSQRMEVVPPGRLFKAPVIQSTVQTITIAPNVQSPTKSVATPTGTTIVAGAVHEVLVTAKDEFGNILDNSDSYFYATADHASESTAHQSSAPVDASKNDGLYAISIRLSIPGQWTINVYDTTDSLIVGCPWKVTVVTGGPHSVVPGPFNVSDAGFPTFIPLIVNDASNNMLDGGSMTVMPSIFVNARWGGDVVTQGRLPFDDVDTRTARFGTVFTNATIGWNTTTSEFQAVITLPLAGLYTIELGVTDGDTPVEITNVTVSAPAISYSAFAVVTTVPFPPTDLTARTITTFTVQPRDKYMNAIATNFSGTAPSVVVRLELDITYWEDTCTNSSTDGQFTCTITPIIAGSSLVLSVLVDGTHATHLQSTDGFVRAVRGPWVVAVSAGPASFSYSYLTNVQSQYTVGVPVTATLILKDLNNNVLGLVDSPPTITVSFTNASSMDTTYVDPTTFVYNADGSVSLPIVSYVSSGASYFTLSIQVYGQNVTLPYGIDPGAIRVTYSESSISASHTVCDAWVNAVAGVANTSICHPYSSSDEPVVQPHLYIYSNFSLRSDTTISPVIVTGTYNASSHLYSIGASLTKAGTYSYYTVLAEPGGLIGQYYGGSDFVDLIGMASDGTSLSDQRFPDDAPMQYTRIDSSINLDTAGPIGIGALTVGSIRWSGFLMPTITDTYTFNITCNGGVRVVIDGGAARVNSLTASSVNVTFTVGLTAYTPVSILVEYIPIAPAAIALRWAYSTMTTFEQVLVPSGVLAAPLSTGQSGNHSIAVSVGPVSTQSTAYFSDFIIAGQQDYITVQAIDSSGNLYTADPTVCIGTSTDYDTVPTCLFQAAMAVDDGTTFDSPPVLMTDGTIRIGVTFALDGPKQVSVKLQTGNGVFTDIQGSPFTVIVNPGR